MIINNYCIAHQKNHVKNNNDHTNNGLTIGILFFLFLSGFFFFIFMLAVINRSILSCGLLSTRKWYVMNFFPFALIYFYKFCEIFIVNDIYFHFHFIKNFLKINHRCLKEVIAQLLYIMIFIIMNLKFK